MSDFFFFLAIPTTAVPVILYYIMFFYDKELNFFIFRFLSLFILLPGTVPTTYKVAVFQILRHYFAHPLSLPVRSESSGLKVKKMQTNLKKKSF